MEPCLYTNGIPDPNCILLPDPGFIPGNPLVLGTNFPVEFFYIVADSNPLTTPGCPASGIAAGKLKWRGALEGSFLKGVDQPGQQSSFARTKIVASGLCPSTAYTFDTPFGVQTFTSDAAGAIVANKKGGTIDTGCLAAPCDFTAALAAPAQGTSVAAGFLQLSAGAPAGYVGDAVTLGTITGSPTSTNFFDIKDPSGVVVASTNLFTVSGKIAGPLMASPNSIDFGAQPVGTPSAARTIKITNVFSAGVTIGTLAFTNTDFTADPLTTTCTTGLALPPDATCNLGVIFTPTAAPIAIENATLQVPYTGAFRSPLNLALAGTSVAANAPAVFSLSPASLPAFPNTRVRTTSATQTVTVNVSTTSTVPLSANVTIANVPPDPVTGLPLPGADQFVKTADTCSGNTIAIGSSCAVSLQFAPTVAATSTALLTFTDVVTPTNQQSVTLNGKGTGGIAAVAATKFLVGGIDTGFPNWYQDENGVQLMPCLDPTDPGCVLIPDPGFTGLPPVVYTSNFPVEFFYFVADSDKMDTPGCPAAGTASTKVTYRAAMEGSFANGVAIAGQDTMFTRTKIVVPPGGLCANTTYAFVTPYGTDLITTDASGGIVANKKGATIDVGCLGTCTGANTALPLSSRVFGGFLKWDPAVAPAAPAGHIGDAGFAGGVGVGTPHPVIGSPYTPPGESAPANFFRIADAATGATLAGCKNAAGVTGPCQVNLFTVSGKLAESVHTSQVSAPGPVNFPATNTGATSAAQTVTLTNGDVNPITIGAASLLITPGGLASPDFSIVAAADHCSNIPLGAGLSCTLDVQFNPTSAGQLAGVLVLPHSGVTDLDSPAEVPLSGTGVGVAPVVTSTTISAPTVTAPTPGVITVTVTAADGTVPTGSVVLTINGVAQASQVLSASGTATTTVTAPGTYILGAAYTPIGNYAPSSGTGSLTINAAAPIATTTSIATTAVTFPAAGVVTITVTSAAGTVTGSVTLSVDGGAPISQALAGGSSIFNVTGLPVGAHTLAASYAAQGSFAASSASGSLTVNPAATTTTIVAPAVTFPSNASIPVSVSAVGATPTGSVSLSIDGGTAITQPLSAAGSTTFTLVSPAVGTHTLSATYATQGNFTGSTATGTLTVNPAQTTEVINATAQASRNRTLTAASWTINGTTNILTPHTMTVTLTRTGASIGSTTTKTNGSWKVSAGKSPIVPVPGDTVTVTSSTGVSKIFPLTVK